MSFPTGVEQIGGNTVDGVLIGGQTTSLIGLYQTTPVAQAAAITTVTTDTTTTTLVTAINALIAACKAIGITL